VALSTCPVEELETAVRIRGATMAIVGVSNDSLDVAERLSHAPHDIKVFLAHYKDARALNAPVNGFAGISDLRVEPGRLAAIIRQSIGQPSQSPWIPSKARRSRPFNMLSRSIEMQKQLSNRQALLELILKNFLELVVADEGLLLLPQGTGLERWRIAASLGEETPLPSVEVGLERACLKAVLDQRIYTRSEGIRLSSSENIPCLPTYLMAVPVMINGQLIACLLSNQFDQPDELEEYFEGVFFLFQQLAKRDAKEYRDRLLAEARQTVCSGWALTDVHGRVIHREGKESMWITHNESEIQDARLQDAIAQAFGGRSGSVQTKGRKVTYRPLHMEQRGFCLLQAGASNDVVQAPLLWREEISLISAFLKTDAGISPKESVLVEELLGIIASRTATSEHFEIRKLAPLGVKMELVSEEVPAALSAGLALILVVAKRLSGRELTGRFLQKNREWFFTVEIAEKDLQDDAEKWAQDPLMKLALRVANLGEVEIKSSIYGLQLSHVATCAA
jgi:hypothetical protein